MFPPLVEDVEYYVLSFLNARELCKSSEVCSAWHKVVVADRAWIHFFPKIAITKPMTFKEHFNNRAIVSLNALLERLVDFTVKLGKKQNGEFYCLFPATTNCYITVRIYNNKRKSFHCDLKERYWFMKTFPIKKKAREILHIGENHNYLLHTKLTKDFNIKEFTKEALNILTQNVPLKEIKEF